jgi:hypothetical protein
MVHARVRATTLNAKLLRNRPRPSADFVASRLGTKLLSVETPGMQKGSPMQAALRISTGYKVARPNEEILDKPCVGVRPHRLYFRAGVRGKAGRSSVASVWLGKRVVERV